jgi:NTP pyrophosphatase (non-canonical NTP hydrolase)
MTTSEQMEKNLWAFKMISLDIAFEIERGNNKHGDGPLATPQQVVCILTEELGEYSQAVMQGRVDDARKELIQVAAVAINHLIGTGPHFSSR